MNEWTTDEGQGYKTKTIQHGPVTITIQRPILTDEERRRRERQVKATLEHILGEYYRRTASHKAAGYY